MEVLFKPIVCSFKPLRYYFKETIGFEKLASFAKPLVSSLIKPGDMTKEFQ